MVSPTSLGRFPVMSPGTAVSRSWTIVVGRRPRTRRRSMWHVVHHDRAAIPAISARSGEQGTRARPRALPAISAVAPAAWPRAEHDGLSIA